MIKRIVYGTLAGLLLSAVLLYVLYVWDTNTGMELSLHAYFALGLGIFLTMMLGVALSYLAFISARNNVDEAAHDVRESDTKEE